MLRSGWCGSDTVTPEPEKRLYRRRDPIGELGWSKGEAGGREVATIVQKTNGKSLNLGQGGRE